MRPWTGRRGGASRSRVVDDESALPDAPRLRGLRHAITVTAC